MRAWMMLAGWVLIVPFFVIAQDEESVADAPFSERAMELESREAALRLLEDDLRKKIEELKELKKQAAVDIEPAETKHKADVDTLIAFYQSMKPKAAAQLLEKLPIGLAADVIGSMKSREAGKILNVMDPDRAVQISRLMASNK